MLLQVLLDLLQVGAGLLDPRALRRPVVDHDLQAAGVGEVQLRHEAKTENRQDQQSHHARPGTITPKADRQRQQRGGNAGRTRPDRARSGPARVSGPATWRCTAAAPIVWQKTQLKKQRNGHDREQAAGVFARVVARRKDRVERHAGHHGRPQERPGRPAGRFDGRLLPIHSLRDADHDAVGHDDRVVDHHPHGDDHCAERDAMQVDAHDGHDDERAEDRKHQPADADDDPRAHAHRQRQERQHDDDGFQQADHEGPNRLAHLVGLPRDALDVDSDGQVGHAVRRAGGRWPAPPGPRSRRRRAPAPARWPAARCGAGVASAGRRSRRTPWRNRGCARISSRPALRRQSPGRRCLRATGTRRSGRRECRCVR